MKARKTAVIAVHGVGDHLCGEMAAAVARRLQMTAPEKYGHFDTSHACIAVTATELCIGAGLPEAAGTASKLWPKSADSRLKLKETAPGRQGSCDIAFTETLLEGGAGYSAEYQTVRLACVDERGDVSNTVHVYEMFWSDLSHGGTSSGWAIFSELMQFFLHMASLGRATLASLLQTLPDQDRCDAKVASIYNASSFGYWLLAIPILMGNLLFVVFGLLLLPLLIPDGVPWTKPGASLVCGVFAAIGAAWYVRHKLQSDSASSGMLRWGVAAAGATAVIVASVLYLVGWDTWLHPRNALFVLEALVLAGACTELMRRYEKSRPEALYWWKLLMGVVAAWGVVSAAYVGFARKNEFPAAVDPMLQWFDYWVEGCFAGLVLAWLLLYAVNFRLLWLSVRAALVVRSLPASARRAIETSLIAASIPAPLFISVILFLWLSYASYLRHSGWERLCAYVKPLMTSHAGTVSAVLDRLLGNSVSAAFLPYLGCLLFALLCLLTGLVPSIIAEVLPSSEPRDDARSRALGNWLDGGFHVLRIGALVALVGFFFLLPVGLSWEIWVTLTKIGTEVTAGAGTPALPWQPDLGWLVGGTTVAFLAASKLLAGASLGGLSRFFTRLRVLVDTALDVDNWLRERPEGATPRLRIMARYASLLRYIEQQRYDRVVIVAHSQGSVITADLFRYLAQHNPELIKGLKAPLLFTLGCPLRQLYALRFPALYGWVGNPSLAGSGFAEWINAYGSGDYVGRYLWHADTAPERWTPGRLHAGQNEWCVGALAHTHYFGAQAPEVGTVLHELISRP